MKLGRSDMRVLKAQLDLTAGVIQATRFQSMVRSLVLALVASDLVGLFGHVSLVAALYLPMIVTLAIGISSSLITVYLSRARGTDDFAVVQAWFLRIIAMQAAISLAWGLMPWLLWEPHNPVNHLFLAAVTIAIMGGMVMSRGSNMPMFFASLLPISLMTTARFALGGS